MTQGLSQKLTLYLKSDRFRYAVLVRWCHILKICEKTSLDGGLPPQLIKLTEPSLMFHFHHTVCFGEALSHEQTTWFKARLQARTGRDKWFSRPWRSPWTVCSHHLVAWRIQISCHQTDTWQWNFWWLGLIKPFKHPLTVSKTHTKKLFWVSVKFTFLRSIWATSGLHKTPTILFFTKL